MDLAQCDSFGLGCRTHSAPVLGSTPWTLRRCVRSTPGAGSRSPTWPRTRSRCSAAGWPRPRRRACTSPTPWSCRPRTPTVGRRRGWCCSRASTTAASGSSPTPARARARTWPANPRCSLLFPWHPLERQVRIDGTAEPLSRADVAAYFSSRPRGSQLGAWASHQSRVVSGRQELTDAFADAEARYPEDVPVPDEWGGYVVVPDAVEFWQGRPGPDARPAGLPPQRGRGRLAGRPTGPVTTR